ncbi:DENN domain-containing protein 1B, partial [Ophiophagus hannah]
MLNVDTNTLETPFNDLSNLPSEVWHILQGEKKEFLKAKRRRGPIIGCWFPATCQHFSL